MADPTTILEHPRLLSADLRRPRPLIAALELLNELTQQIGRLHAEGSTHRAIHAALELPEGQRPRLAAPPTVVRFGGEWSDPELCPPELADGPELELPANITAANALLAAHDRPLDARQIDLYQLGTLFCRLLTGGSVLAYMYSPAVKAGLSAATRALLDRLLGFDPERRFHDCTELADSLSAHLVEQRGRGSQATPADDLPFARLDKYRILARLGRGGMGDVYKAHDESLDRTVALKVLPPMLARHEDFVRRFRAEANAIARLVHPNVVQIFATGEDEGHHYFVMQFVDGESLAERLSRRRCLGIDDALRICEQCLVGLAAAHDAGLVHRDVKPANVLLEARTGRVLLADFGLVKTLGASAEITATGVILGTVDYISPEQARGLPVDGRSDLYSLGVMLFEMLSGVLPFEADSPTAMVFQHAYEPPRVLSAVDPGVPHSLEAIVRRLLSKDPSRRYESARAVLADLQAFREGRRPAAETAKQEDIEAGRDSNLLGNLDVLLAGQLATLPTPGRWQWLRDRLAGLFYRYAPEALKELQSTSQQVDGALAEYARRREHLAELLAAARSAAADLEAQPGPGLRADDLAALRGQSERQRECVAELESQLSRADATLARLRSQRDLLHARLKTAQARTLFASGRPSTRRERLHRMAMITGWGVLLIMIAVAAKLSVSALGWKPSLKVAPPSTMTAAPPASPPAESAESSVGIIHTQATPQSMAFHPESIAGTHRFVVGNSDGTVVEYSIGSQGIVRGERPTVLGTPETGEHGRLLARRVEAGVGERRSHDSHLGHC